ncbi:cation-transporting P-type ATPase [Methylophaga pinxianii]|uniref:cation-transporting P-type ATPase n=1 Tax=Methylophaga pinxianii TaxID=2881052 RepID=UPI001CF4AFED|nr:cation-transporting P-type ATPase [Methylophaga pinxianii]MCB2426850.1 cation-transporting P-type ATPase [Methylophaga pinxianii]UPH47036.1 cation-transporting P-type ATPase [Methylophaga pinxianii]
MSNDLQKQLVQIPWHHLDSQESLTRLNSQKQGLNTEDAEQRLQQFGANHLPYAKNRSAFARLFAQMHNLLIYVLLGAALLTALLAHWIDFWVILAVVILNTLIGFVQEGKAEKALDAIKNMLAPHATVIRNGHRLRIEAADLVPGDVVVLEPGDKVPADLRLFSASVLQIQEAVLTGESVAVEKHSEPVAEDAVLGDRLCMAYCGTLVTSGQGHGVVVATGSQTEIGRISSMMSSVENLTTPLLQQISFFSRWLTLIIILIAGLVFSYGYWVNLTPAIEMFMIVVGVAVAGIPEGLPAILTITLAIGVQRMASRNAIIRRLPAVETLGAVSIICSDKTGTLTRNEMTVSSVINFKNHFHVTGIGYAPAGEFSLDDQPVELRQYDTLMLLLRCAAICNDSALKRRDEEWLAEGDPMEAAMLTAALKADFTIEELKHNFPRRDVIPFDTSHRFMATLHHDHQGHDFIAVKGAPEKIIELCQFHRIEQGDKPIDHAYWHSQIEIIAAEGQRVLAIATKTVAQHSGELQFEDLDEGLVLLGLIGLIDPPREEAIKAVNECHKAGIQVKMITGDHAATASAIASQLGLHDTKMVLTGHELTQLSDAELQDAVNRTDVFARTAPEHKLRLVSALQANGHVVAMTGDGVNDAPALKRADVGIAMGKGGTEAAKEAAEMVLVDDNFASIVKAVREGRTVYDNLKKAILFLLPINGGESLSIIVAVMVGMTLPITPLQILWINMVSSIALALSLAFEPGEEDAMYRKPRQRDEKMLSGFLLWRISFVSLLFVLGVYGMFLWSQSQGASIEQSRTYAVNTLVVMEVFYLFNVRCLNSASWSIKKWFTSYVVFISIGAVMGLQLLFTYSAFMNRLFESTPIDWRPGMEIMAVGAIMYCILELEKWLRRLIVQNHQTIKNTKSPHLK